MSTDSEAGGSLFSTVATWAWAAFWLFLALLPTIVAGYVGPLVGDKKRRVAHALLAGAYRIIVRLHPTYTYNISGLEHLRGGPAVLCPNHDSYADVVYLFSLPGQIRWVIKKELFRVPLFGFGLYAAGYLAIDRGDWGSAQNLVDRALESVSSGVSVLSFPEGTRTRSGELGPFHSGPARLAIAAGVPIIPIGVAGTRELLAKGYGWLPARAHVTIHLGEPIQPSTYEGRTPRALTRELRERVSAAREVAVAERSERVRGWRAQKAS